MRKSGPGAPLRREWRAELYSDKVNGALYGKEEEEEEEKDGGWVLEWMRWNCGV